jgi:hypothetical protein
MLCEYESHLGHLSESGSDLSDCTTIWEIECFDLDGTSDTPSELREVVDRSMEAIWHSMNLSFTSSVLFYVVLGDIGMPNKHAQ